MEEFYTKFGIESQTEPDHLSRFQMMDVLGRTKYLQDQIMKKNKEQNNVNNNTLKSLSRSLHAIINRINENDVDVEKIDVTKIFEQFDPIKESQNYSNLTMIKFWNCIENIYNNF